MARDPPPESLDSIVQPEQFLDSEIQRYVKAIPISSTEGVDLEPQSKRRKTGLPQTLPKVTSLLWKLARTEPRDTLAEYSSALR